MTAQWQQNEESPLIKRLKEIRDQAIAKREELIKQAEADVQSALQMAEAHMRMQQETRDG